MRLVRNECTQLSACGEMPYVVFQFVEEAVVRNFVKCFLEIEKDGVCLYSIIDIVCKIVYELDKLCFC